MISVLAGVERNIKNAVKSEFTKGDLYQQKGGNLNQRYSFIFTTLLFIRINKYFINIGGNSAMYSNKVFGLYAKSFNSCEH